MAFALNVSDLNYSYSTDTTITISLAVTAGDLIVIGVSSSVAAVQCTSVADNADGGSNSYTLGTLRASTTTNLRLAYAIAKASESLTITGTYGDASAAGHGIVGAAFTPSAGETISYLDTAYTEGGYDSGVITTASDLNTEGVANELAVAIFATENGNEDFSSQEIPAGTGATMAEDPGGGAGMSCLFYQVLASTQLTNEEAQVTQSGQEYWCGEVYAFKAEASTGDWTTYSDITMEFGT